MKFIYKIPEGLTATESGETVSLSTEQVQTVDTTIAPKDRHENLGSPAERLDKTLAMFRGEDAEANEVNAEMSELGELTPEEKMPTLEQKETMLQTVPTSMLLERAEKSPQDLQDLFLENGVVDFHSHRGARQKIGVADLYPNNEDHVYVKVGNNVGKRSIHQQWGKAGYLGAAGGYLEILGGESVSVLKLPQDKDVIDTFEANAVNIQTYSDTQEQKYREGFLARQKNAEKYEHLLDLEEAQINNGENLKGMALANNPEFAHELGQVAGRLGVSTRDLLFVIEKESRINPKAVNLHTGATGLIQFMPRTAMGLGTSVGELRTMSSVDQLAYVEKYFEPYKGNLNSVEDLYMATFYPYAINKPDHFVIGSERGERYAQLVADQNPAISQGQNRVTKADFYGYVRR